jgi:DMSO reductase iron-sulfur subunit
MAKQLGFYMNMDRCTGCKTCEVACVSERKLPEGVRWRMVREFKTEMPPSASFLSMACNHCADPACMKVCPVKAYSKRADGIVVQNHAACIGCKACIAACPYAALIFDAREGKTSKCDYCAERVDKGGMPRCAEACPNEALVVGPLEELQAKYGNIRTVKGLPSADAIGPSIVIRPTKATAL